MGRIPTRNTLNRLASLPKALLAVLLCLLFLPAAVSAGEENPDPVEAAAGTTAPAEESVKEPADDTQQLKWAIDGYLNQEARLRHVDSDTDFDLYTHIFVDVTHRGDRVWKARVNGRLFADVGGNQKDGDLLRDIWDGFDHDVQFRVYEAYVETEGLFDMLGLRGGRQFMDEGVYLHFDGIRLNLDLGNVYPSLDATMVFGVPVQFGEPNRYENWLVGVVVRAKVGDRTRMRLEYYHINEFFEGINQTVVDPLQQPQSISSGEIEDDLLGISLWHRFRDTLRFFGRFSLLNGDANELHLRLRWFTKDGKWAAVLEWYQMFERLLNVTNDLTPFVPMLGSLQPFYRISLRVTHRIGDDWIFQAGLSHRELDDESDEGTFNHEYNHYYASASRLNLLKDGQLDLTVTVNGFASSGNDVVAVAGNADLRLSKKILLSGGVNYALYKYDFFLNTEHEDVWTTYVRIRWQAKEKIRVTGELSIDDDDFETWVTFLFKVTVRF